LNLHCRPQGSQDEDFFDQGHSFWSDEFRPAPHRIFLHVQAQSKKIDLVFGGDDDFPSIVADRSSIIQILVNLVSNALKFTKDDGTVRISAFRKVSIGGEGQSHLCHLQDIPCSTRKERLTMRAQWHASDELNSVLRS
jgi:hypothetical protein